MGLTPLTFSGVSTFSTDFQTILNRALSIANIPVQNLQNQQKDLLQQKLLVSNLSTAVEGLSSSIQNLGSIAEQKALLATSSNSAKVTASAVNAPSTATYSISNITSIASAASETSLSGYASTDPVSSTGTLQLTLGSNSYPIHLNPSQNNLAGLRDAINKLGVGLSATILTTGNGAQPNYLSVTANSAGATTLRLNDDPTGTNTNLLTSNNQGSDTVFKFNGVSVSRKGTLVNDLVPGTTFSILGTTSGSETITISLNTDRSQIADALKSFVSEYNNVSDQVTAQTGKNAGLLSGDFLVRQTADSLRALTSYQSSGSIKNLASLGVEFDSSGKATFNQDTFDALSDSDIQAALQFLGSKTSGFSALGANFSQISDPVTGLAKLQQDRYADTDKRLTDQISRLQERISAQQAALSSRLQAADALLGQLQSQQNVITASIQSFNLVLYGKNNNNQ